MSASHGRNLTFPNWNYVVIWWSINFAFTFQQMKLVSIKASLWSYSKPNPETWALDRERRQQNAGSIPCTVLLYIYTHTFDKLDPCSSDKHTLLYMEAKMHYFRHCTWEVYAKNYNQGNISIAFLQTRFLLYESSVVLKAECKRNISFICIENADRCIRGVKTKVKNEDRH